MSTITGTSGSSGPINFTTLRTTTSAGGMSDRDVTIITGVFAGLGGLIGIIIFILLLYLCIRNSCCKKNKRLSYPSSNYDANYLSSHSYVGSTGSEAFHKQYPSQELVYRESSTEMNVSPSLYPTLERSSVNWQNSYDNGAMKIPRPHIDGSVERLYIDPSVPGKRGYSNYGADPETGYRNGVYPR